MAYNDFPQSLYGQYNEDKHKQGDPVLDVLLDVRDQVRIRFPDALQLQVSSSLNPPGTSNYLKFTNNTTVPISINQLVNAEAFSTGTDEGTSLISVLMFINPDFTGAIDGASDTKAYANGFDGKFVDVTGTGILLSVLDGFDAGINTDVLRLTGGQVTYFTSAQGLTSSSLNGQVLLNNPITIASGDSVVFGFINTALVDGGTEVLTTALFSGVFITDGDRVEIAPDNLIAENGDNLITEDGDNLVTG